MIRVVRSYAVAALTAALAAVGTVSCTDSDKSSEANDPSSGSGDDDVAASDGSAGAGNAGSPGQGSAGRDSEASGGAEAGASNAGDDDADSEQDERAGAAGVGAGAGGSAGDDGAASGTDEPDLSAPFFAEDHVVEVEIELDPDDWDALRSEGRSLLQAMIERGYSYEYTYFDADVTIDGERYEDVGIRKKGFLGSLSMFRPSLKLDLNRNLPDQSHLGLKKLTLNNNKQDPTNARQCLSYDLFASVGLPSPRCNLARVSVNGEDLGVYTNLEPVDKAMVGRHFEDSSGNLYEGQAADFDRATVEHFEMKTNEDTNDRSDLIRVVEALERPDDEVVEALSAVVDLDSFRTFWAMEALVGHWDSYSGNANNFDVYHDPTSDLLYFIPWGTDGAFDGLVSYDPNRDITVFALGKLANRLYGLPEERARYRERLGELVDTAWDETALLAGIDRVAELAPESSAADLDTLRDFAENRAANMTAALAQPARDWVDATEAEPSRCEFMKSELNIEFDTVWGDITTAAPGSGEFVVDMSMDEQAIQTDWFGMAGMSASFAGTSPTLQMTGFLPDQRMMFLFLAFPPNTLEPGVWPLHGIETWGMISVMNADGTGYRMLSYVGDGELVFDDISAESGAPVVGRLSAYNLQLECLDP